MFLFTNLKIISHIKVWLSESKVIYLVRALRAPLIDYFTNRRDQLFNRTISIFNKTVSNMDLLSWNSWLKCSDFLVIVTLLQWNPDFSNTRLFETPDSSNQKSFPLDLLQSNTVILHPIFRILDFSKLPIFRTNSFFLSKIYIRFLELWKLRNQTKPVLATYTPECN